MKETRCITNVTAIIFMSSASSCVAMLLLLLLLFLWPMLDKISHMVFLSTCWSVSSLQQCSRCSSSMLQFGIWHIVPSLGSYMPVFLKQAARQSCPVLSLKFVTASFLGLSLYSAQISWISLRFFVAAISPVSCLHFVAILRLKHSNVTTLNCQ